MRAIVGLLRRFAQADANVLITGETGVGKDAVALAIHALGPRHQQPFVKIDCPSVPPTLIESELFGYERGAFTDAAGAKPGRFEMAGRGTVYLDGVGELSIDAQAKLLRLVEDKRVERIGGTVALELHARVVASAGSELEQAVRDGAFRDDLYHRLRVLPIHIPPLRERRADVLPLARAFLTAAARRANLPALSFTPAAEAMLQRYWWPGNVRELHHIVERTVLAAEPPQAAIDAGDLPLEVADDPRAYFEGDGQARPTLEEVERRYIELVLREARGNQTKAAAVLGISRKALWEKRKRYGLR
jgi:transcriptional regulator with PAS, ATPase and Fis domain